MEQEKKIIEIWVNLQPHPDTFGVPRRPQTDEDSFFDELVTRTSSQQSEDTIFTEVYTRAAKAEARKQAKKEEKQAKRQKKKNL